MSSNRIFNPETLDKTSSNDSFKSFESNESYKSVDDYPQGDLIVTDNFSEVNNLHIMDLDLLTMSDRDITPDDLIIIF